MPPQIRSAGRRSLKRDEGRADRAGRGASRSTRYALSSSLAQQGAARPSRSTALDDSLAKPACSAAPGGGVAPNLATSTSPLHQHHRGGSLFRGSSQASSNYSSGMLSPHNSPSCPVLLFSSNPCKLPLLYQISCDSMIFLQHADTPFECCSSASLLEC